MVAIDVQVTFYSYKDEDAFFAWVARIPCIKKVDPVTIYVRSKILSKEDLLELTALQYRYRADMAQLQQFCNPRNEQWFKAPGMYWHKRVFGAAKTNARPRKVFA